MENHLEAKKNDVVASEKKLKIKKLITPTFLTFCPNVEQSVFVPASLHNNKSLKTQAVTKRELPKDQVKQNLAY